MHFQTLANTTRHKWHQAQIHLQTYTRTQRNPSSTSIDLRKWTLTIDNDNFISQSVDCRVAWTITTSEQFLKSERRSLHLFQPLKTQRLDKFARQVPSICGLSSSHKQLVMTKTKSSARCVCIVCISVNMHMQTTKIHWRSGKTTWILSGAAATSARPFILSDNICESLMASWLAGVSTWLMYRETITSFMHQRMPGPNTEIQVT